MTSFLGVPRAAWFGCIAAFAALLALSCWNPTGEFWVGVEPPKAQCEAYDAAQLASLPRATDELYAPAALRRLLREPQNTVSNFAYLVVGVVVWCRSKRAASRVFAVACGGLALGSGLYHATLLPEWRLLDMMGVYAALFTLLAAAIAFARRSTPRSSTEWIVHGGIFLVAVWCAVHRNDFRWWNRFKPLDSTNVVLALIAALALAALVALRRASPAERPRAWRLFLALAGFGLLAAAGGRGDRFAGFWADPEALIQGHTVWHVGGAIALGLAHELFASTAAQKTQV